MPLKGLKIELEVHRALKKVATSKDETMQSLAERAIREMLDRSDGADHPPKTQEIPSKPLGVKIHSSQLTTNEEGFIEECLRIHGSGFGYAIQQLIAMLESGNVGVGKAILSNLAVFSLVVSAKMKDDEPSDIELSELDTASFRERIGMAHERKMEAVRRANAIAEEFKRNRDAARGGKRGHPGEGKQAGGGGQD